MNSAKRSDMRVRLRVFPWAVLALLLAAPQARADVELTEVAPGVLAALQPDELRFSDSNSVVIINDEDILVVDAQADGAHVRALIDKVRSTSDKPVRTLVNTHWHGDHTQGNALWREAWGGDLEIIGHDTHPEDIEQRAVPQAQQDADELASALRHAEEELSEGRGLQGEKLDEDGRMALRARLDRNYALLEARRAIRWELPDRTFEDRLVLERGSRTIELRHYTGHTRGDVVLYLPAEKVLISGDLVDDLPYGGHGNPRAWLETLQELDRIDFDVLVPGHGRVRHGKEHLRLIMRLVQSILDQVQAAVDDGADLETTKERVDLSEFRDILAPDDVARRNFDAFMPDTIEQAWLEARGAWTGEPPDSD